MIQTSGFVDRYEILDEWKEKAAYFVRLKAWVKSDESLDMAYRALSQDRVIEVLGEGPGVEHIEREIKKGMSSRFYRVSEKGQSPAIPDFRILISPSVKEGGVYGEIHSFYVSVAISMARGTSAESLVFVSTERPVAIHGLTENQALDGKSVNQYFEKVARPLVSDFWKRLSEVEKEGSRPVRVEIAGVPNLEAFREFRDYVKDIRLGMGGVLDEEYHDGWGVLKVKYRERSLYLATIIQYPSRYRVVEYGQDRIRVIYQGEKP